MDEHVLALLRDARRQLESERQRRTAPVAIVGIGCRFPGGVTDTETYWRLLEQGIDATGDVPPDRWDADAFYDPDPEQPGKTYTKRGAFLDQIDQFDPDFFGISPREAKAMDPQQRLLLEMVWEALEDAGISAQRLRGTATGVWVGLCADDYARRNVLSGDPRDIDAYGALGNSDSVAAGRISYFFDLRGPTVQLDTACSSSLVAIHQACQSLRLGECDLAIVAGVNLMSAPETTIALCKLRALAPDGRCKAFDAAADGYGRGEGCGVVVLKRLDDASAAGDRIHATIRGSAVNHDGHSNGLTAPNGLAQEAVIRTALASADLAGADIGYVEAHGTGTLLGDPIEVLALHRVYGEGRALDDPLAVGTVKTNFGHLEGAAGIAGLIKVVLCLQHGALPASLHLRELNPKVPWSKLAVRVVDRARGWAPGASPRRAGVSSFGISGTNAHVILEQAPSVQRIHSAPRRSAELVVLSAKTPPALVSLAGRLRQHLEAHPEVGLGDFAYNLLVRRSVLDHRAALAVPSREALLDALGNLESSTVAGEAAPRFSASPRVVFVFPGQGSQWLGMGRSLLAEEPVFREALLACDRAIQLETGWSAIDVLNAADGAPALERMEVIQPLLFAFQVALAALWRSWGIAPDVVVGHSMGEIAAACVAGALSLTDGARVICRRSRLLQSISGQGAMALVELSLDEARAALRGVEDQLSVAVSNGPRSTVLSGDPTALGQVLGQLESRGVFCRRVKVDVASHSPQVDTLLPQLCSLLSELRPHDAPVAMLSTVTASLVAGTALDGNYWAANLRNVVRFGEAVSSLLSDGYTHFVEVSPHPLLVGAIEQLGSERGTAVVAVGSLRREQPERLALLESLGLLYVHGYGLSAERLFPDGGRHVPLPSYPWQRARYWIESGTGAATAGRATGHPLLGVRISTAGADAVYEATISVKSLPWLEQHRVGGHILLPGAAIAELLRAAGEDHAGGIAREVRALVLQAPLSVPAAGSRRMQVIISDAGAKIELFSRASQVAEDAPWTQHAAAELAEPSPAAARLDLAALRLRCAERVEVQPLYESLAALGLQYGPAFRGLRAIWRNSTEVLAEVVLDGDDASRYGAHPALLDAALQAVAALLQTATDAPLLPFGIARFTLHQQGATEILAYARCAPAAGVEAFEASVTLVDSAGQVVAELDGVTLRPADPGRLTAGQQGRQLPDSFYRLEWQKTEPVAPSSSLSGRWCAIAFGDGAAALALTLELRGAGAAADAVDEYDAGSLAGADHVLCCFAAAGGDAAEAALSVTGQALELIQAVLQQAPAPRVWFVTRSGVALATGDRVRPECSALWGFGRAVSQEQPGLKLTLLDLDAEASLVEVLCRELNAGSDENQLAWRAGERHAARLVRVSAATSVVNAQDYSLEMRRQGTLDALRLVPGQRRAPAAGEVEIEVKASGLNFHDVAIALGLLELEPLGGECAGIVRATGPGVRDLAVGDAVMALAHGSFRRFVTVDARLVARIPRGLSYEQAAGIPAVFLTAWYALRDLASLRPGERILIHAAAGGVGGAAIQLARWIGADVIATASPAKWAMVRAAGVVHLASSRDLEFASAFRAIPGGVQVVLNSLKGDFVNASLSLLSPGGRFIEMGKTDIRNALQIAQAHPGVSYRSFDVMEAGVERLSEMLRDIAAGFESGHLTPLPVRTFPITDAEQAFRFMAQARHTGKLVLLPPRDALRKPGSVFISGGLGTLGLEAAKVFAAQGVAHLVLAGRRGMAAPGAEAAVAELQSLGAQVTVAAVDIEDREALRQVLAAIPAEYPLRGVVHAAGTLQDGLLADQTPERFARVMGAKVIGAWNLHELTLHLDLDQFVLFSSLAGVLGSAGQTGYSAANSFLDGLAALRRGEGLPGKSLAWGQWSERGLAAALTPAQKARLSALGLGAIAPDLGRRLFEQTLSLGETLLIVAPIDVRQLTKALGSGVPPLWRSLVRVTSAGGKSEQVGWLRELAALPSQQRLSAATQGVRAEVARVLGSNAASIGLDVPLKDLGFDSLMAVELRNALGRRTGRSLRATLAFDYPTIQAIAGHLIEELGANGIAQTPSLATTTSGRSDEAIAVVGIGCRLPGGVTDVDSFWRLLEAGVDAITEVPATRWDVDEWYDPDVEAPGKMVTRWGGFLDHLDRFEPTFFGISPREALSIDPQERLLLETTWEALEFAGIKPETLMGSATGVYMGLCGTEYQRRVMADASAIDAYAVLGTVHSTIVGRLSYWLGLKGPNLPVDTACSSSLVAIHLACQALRQGECQLALAGGANVMLSPETTVGLSRLRALSPTGHCRAFSADADGFVRAEGAGVVVLERLSDAKRHGHRVLALVRGTAINQDGRSNGLTAPNGPSQEAVIAEALRRGGVAPADVGYVECHGTGTPLGDPIEVQALARVLAEGRPRERPVVLGTLKSNVGHMEGAAGVGGFIKAVLMLQHGRIPKSLHFTAPNPHIPWSELPVQVASEAMAWQPAGMTRIAGVSSFGISGTNAHVVLEEGVAPAPAAPAPERAAELIVLSAKTPEALSAVARRLLERIEADSTVSVRDLAFSLVTARSVLEQRLCVPVASRTALLEALRAASEGKLPAGAQRGSSGSAQGKLVWLFTGQGAQRLGMGKPLYAEWPVFRAAVDEACALFDAELEVPLRDVMWAEPGSASAALLDQTGYTQPALFVVERALAELWKSWGVVPDFVLGHSIGQLTAATIAGVFRLQDAVRLVAGRARLMQALPGGGAMLAITASEEQAREALQPFSERVSIAAINGPTSVVISGDATGVAALDEQFRSRGVKTQRLTVSHAFHSPLMEPMLEPFRVLAQSSLYSAPRIPIISDTTGVLAGPELLTPEHWVQHVRQPVRFAAAVRELQRAGTTTYLELGPRPTLLGLVAACVPESEPTLLASLRPSRPEPEAILEALGGWVARGGAVDWKAVIPAAQRIQLPTYPWQRERFWIDAPLVGGRSGEVSQHPLLGARIAAAGAGAMYESVVSQELPWLRDHRVGGHALVPAAALAELMRAAAEDFAQGSACELRAVVFSAPVLVPSHRPVRVQVVISLDGSRASVHSQPLQSAAGGEWRLHATAEIGAQSVQAAATPELQAIRERCSEAVDVSELYASLRKHGLEHGPYFQRLRQLKRGTGEILAEVALGTAEENPYGLHPALLDAALQSVAALVPAAAEHPLVPFEFGRLVLHQTGVQASLVHVRLLGEASADVVQANLTLLDASGRLVAELDQLTLRRIDVLALAQPADSAGSDAFYRLEWPQLSQPSAPAALDGHWRLIALGDDSAALAAASELRSRGAQVEIARLAELRELPAAEHVVCLFSARGAEGATLASQLVGAAVAVSQAVLQGRPPRHLWWVTRNGVAVSDGDDVEPAASAVWGVGRSLIQEHPELRVTLLDLDADAALAQALSTSLAATDDEDQVAWRGGRRHAARMVRARARDRVLNGANYQLQLSRKGTLDELRLVVAERAAPQAGEIEIEVAASGLNFRDVLNALGIYPGEAGPLGAECSGRVSAVGAGVERFKVGDTVMALAQGGFRRFVNVDQRLAAPVPLGVSLEQAATLPVAFLTAWYALHDLAQLRAGERLLIHSAAGGVGMAAVQVARWIGARVLGTASPSKWHAVQALGVEHLASSRQAGFAKTFRAIAGGVDVVLNALTGELIDESLALLVQGGRFIEMGKADVRDPAAVAAAHPGLRYRAFDLTEAGLDRIAEMFAAIAEGFAGGHLSPLPLHRFRITDAESAFRFMARAQHVGKIVLLSRPSSATAGGTVLVTGGLGALGLQVAKHFAERGWPHLLLVGRRGMDAPGAQRAVEELQRSGAKVSVAAVDVADREALATVLAAIPPELPLRAVVHAAAIVDDALIGDQTPERISRVLAPKVSGAWNLHELTARCDLEHFVCFSSLAGTLGAAAQANYSAANAFLEGLTAHRRAHGQPASCLAWGPWSGAGLAARLDAVLQSRFARQGLRMLSPERGRRLFGEALERQDAQLVVAAFDLRVLSRALGAAVPPVWRSLVRAVLESSIAASSVSWRQELEALPDAQRLDAVRAGVQAELARVLSVSPPTLISLDQPLQSLGLDSLMAVELRNALGRRAGVPLPASLALDYPTPDALARKLLELVTSGASPARGDGARANGTRASAVARAAPLVAHCERLSRLEQGSRLFCFHDAGGDGAMFLPFAQLKLAGVEIHAISHNRVGDDATAGRGERYLAEVVDYIRNHSDRPYALFGHSLGALLAHRVTQELVQTKEELPRFLALSALPPDGTDAATGPRRNVDALMKIVLGARSAVDASSLKALQAAFAADLALWDSIPPALQRLIPIAIAAFVGAKDEVVSADAMRSWQEYTTQEFSLTVLPGSHLYLYEADPRVRLMRELAREFSGAVFSAARSGHTNGATPRQNALIET